MYCTCTIHINVVTSDVIASNQTFQLSFLRRESNQASFLSIIPQNKKNRDFLQIHIKSHKETPLPKKEKAFQFSLLFFFKKKKKKTDVKRKYEWFFFRRAGFCL